MLATILTFLVVSVITLGAPLTSVPPPTTSLLEPSSLSSLAANITGNPQFDSIVVFGDQCSDNGTGSYVATEHKWPSDRRYYHRRFTNGKTWVEHLASNHRVPYVSYAVGGATTSNTLVQGYTGRDFKTPVQSGGMNDFLFGQSKGVTGREAAQSLGSAMLQLKDTSLILLATLPNPLNYPYSTFNPYAAPSLANFTLGFRDALYSFDIQNQNVAIVDLYALFSEINDHANVFGYDEGKLDQACLTGVYGESRKVEACSTPTQRVWWDEFNPTSTTHSYMASLAWNVLKTQRWVV